MSDEELIRELQNATDGMMMMSESDYPFEVVRWDDAPPEGKVTPEYLRLKAGVTSDAPVVEQSVEEFFAAAVREPESGASEGDVSARFRALVALLKSSLDEVQAYRVGDINIGIYIVGRNRDSNNLIGVSTRVVET